MLKPQMAITESQHPFMGLFFFLIGGKLLYSVMLVSPVQQCKSAIIVCVSPPSPPPIPPFWVITEHQARLPVLYSNLRHAFKN